MKPFDIEAAKAFIESKLIDRSSIWRDYRRSPQTSRCGYRTGKTWIHEIQVKLVKNFILMSYINSKSYGTQDRRNIRD